MGTVALSLIVKDEFEDVDRIVQSAINYVDEINLVVSDRKTATKLQTISKPFKNINVKYRKWNDRFDEARNVAMDMCTTDYFFWIDADDTFDFKVLPGLVKMADENNIDAIFLPYNYLQDDNGNCVTRHWRERLVRLGRGYTWRGWVHETCITDDKNSPTHKVDIEVKHNATLEDTKGSYERNHQILLKAYEATKDPRYLHYLGMSFFSRKEYERSIHLLGEYLKVGGSLEDVYRALATISECAYHLGKHDMALEYAAKCTTLKPEYPMGYWLLAQYEADQDNFNEALEWIHVSETKPDPDTLSVWDPSSRERAVLIAVRSLFMLGRYNEALAQARRIPHNEDIVKLYDDLVNEADTETFIKILPKMRQFFKDDKTLWESLNGDIKYDNRLRALREAVNPPKKWTDKSIVFFCGQGYEEWGPHTADKGMGGSEEAMMYLSKELAKLGWSVTVFAEADCMEKFIDDEWITQTDSHLERGEISGDGVFRPYPVVHWYPWQQADLRDEFNVFVAWRNPQLVEKVNAKVKLIDVHDVMPESVMKDYPDATYMVKTNYHRGLSPHLPDERFAIIGNGIVKEQFK